MNTGVTTLSLDGLNTSAVFAQNATVTSSTSADILVLARPGIPTAASGASIAGNLAIDSESVATGKAVVINDTPALNDLTISANISDGGLGGGTLYKLGSGLGRLVLSGNNTYSSTTSAATGIINLQNSNALGTIDQTETVTLAGARGARSN